MFHLFQINFILIIQNIFLIKNQMKFNKISKIIQIIQISKIIKYNILIINNYLQIISTIFIINKNIIQEE